jgi:hypothetical protein
VCSSTTPNISTRDAGRRVVTSFTATYSGDHPMLATMDLIFADFGGQPPGG